MSADQPALGAKEAASDPRLDLTAPLKPGNAVAAIIVVDGRYLLQLRDAKRTIFFPSHWGCFGGGVDPGESEVEALIRELDEELGLKIAPDAIKPFSRFDFGLDFVKLPGIWRIFCEIELPLSAMPGLVLGEGSRFELFPAAAILTQQIPITPYDAFALWMHINQHRLVG